ncbi:uncharacterized protein LOC144124758 [Amblyomma americanum]
MLEQYRRLKCSFFVLFQVRLRCEYPGNLCYFTCVCKLGKNIFYPPSEFIEEVKRFRLIIFRKTPAVELKAQKTKQDRDLQTSLALVFEAVDNWLEANDGLEPEEAERRLKELLTEVAEQHKLLSAIEDDEDDEDEVRAYGLGTKLKKWRKKAKKILADAAKAVVVNKVVGAAAGALG